MFLLLLTTKKSSETEILNCNNPQSLFETKSLHATQNPYLQAKIPNCNAKSLIADPPLQLRNLGLQLRISHVLFRVKPTKNSFATLKST